MNIDKDTAVTLTFKVTTAQGKVLDDSKDPMVYLHGGYDNTLPKIEAALQGKAPGEKVVLSLKAEDAFGARDESRVRVIPKTEFPPGIKVGGTLQGPDEKGEPQVYTVMKIKGPEVHLDGNHPWAGLDLVFALNVVAVRAASPEEIAHRHVHGEHGHHH